jgi:hypothetical protein
MALVPVVPYTTSTFNPSAWDAVEDTVTFADLAAYALLNAPSFTGGIQVTGLTHALGDLTVDGSTIFSDEIPTTSLVWNPSAPYITNANQFLTKAFADATYAAVAGEITASGANVFTGTNTFNSNLPTSTQTPTTSTQLITKAYADTTYATVAGEVTAAGANAFTGTNTFNSNLPTSTQTPTSSTQLITKAYGDSTYSTAGGSGTLAGANVWTGTNDYSVNLPTSTLTAVTSNTCLITQQIGNIAFTPKAVFYQNTSASSLQFVVSLQPGQLTFWENNDYYVLRFAMSIGWGSNSAGDTSDFACATGTMLVYPNRCHANWCVQNALPTLANINNSVNGHVDYNYVDLGTTNAGNPIAPAGREFFCTFTTTGGSSQYFSVGGTSTTGDFAFYIQNPIGGMFCDFSLELLNHGNPHGVLSTTGFQSNFSF